LHTSECLTAEKTAARMLAFVMGASVMGMTVTMMGTVAFFMLVIAAAVLPVCF
jgi:hypothetical protein